MKVLLLVVVILPPIPITGTSSEQLHEGIYINDEKTFYGLDEESYTDRSLNYKPPELELQFLHMNVNGLSVGTRLFPEFSNMADLMGGILLHTAVEENNLNMIESLIDIGSDLNLEDSEGVTPVFRALKVRSEEASKLLIDAGADINFKSNLGSSLLHTCVTKGDVDVLRRLIQLGAAVDSLNNDGVTPLYKAAEKSDHSAMQALLEGNAYVDWTDENRRSLLHIAVSKGRLDVVKELIRIGAKVDTVDKEEATPLYTAMVLNNPGIMRVLVDGGASSNLVLPSGRSLLHKAIVDGRTDVIQKLILAGADLYSLDNHSLSPLYLAIKMNLTSAIQTLIKYNIDINKPTLENKYFPLHFTVSNGTIGSLNLLIEHGAEAFVINEEGLTPLVLAMYLDKTDMTQVLYNTSPVVNYRSEPNGNTPLHLAVLKKDVLFAEKLLKRGAKVDTVNAEGHSPLCKAALINDVNLIKLLAKNGAKINFKTAHGDSPLHLAVSSKSISAVVTLLELGADINAVDSKKMTPLCKAIGVNATNMVNTLLVKGANIEVPCSDELPVHLAINNGSLSMVKRLINIGRHPPDYSQIIEKAVESNNPEVFKYFLYKNINNSQSEYARLLFIAASSGSSEIITELLKLGTNVNTATESGFTPIWFAVKNNKLSAMKNLIDHGANLLNSVTYNSGGLELRGWTLLHEAAFNELEGALKILLEAGLDVNVKDERTWTPLHYAATQHNLAAIKILIQRGANTKAKTRMGELPIDLVKRRRNFEPSVIKWLEQGTVS